MSKKLLVIDDEPMVRHFLRRAVEEMGHEVIEAADGAEVAEIIEREHPALVLLDVHMPQLDGIATLSEILDSDPSIAVIMVSGDDDLKLSEMAMERGACDYITKPIDLRSLQMSVKAYLPWKI